MELYEQILNITNVNIEEGLKQAIFNCQEELKGLTEERMCKVYHYSLLQLLNEQHILARIVNTLDLQFEFEHLFLLIPKSITGGEYFLADLTFSQFHSSLEEFEDLKKNGYQFVSDELFQKYLEIVTKDKNISFTLEDAFYLESKKR